MLDTDRVERLCGSGADVNAYTTSGILPLHFVFLGMAPILILDIEDNDVNEAKGDSVEADIVGTYTTSTLLPCTTEKTSSYTTDNTNEMKAGAENLAPQGLMNNDITVTSKKNQQPLIEIKYREVRTRDLFQCN